MEKLKHLKNIDLRYIQKYMKQASLENARLELRYKIRMLNNRANMAKRYTLKYCPHCPAGWQDGVVENSQHWLECAAYKALRVGVDPENVLEYRVRYIRGVQLFREQLDKMVGR